MERWTGNPSSGLAEASGRLSDITSVQEDKLVCAQRDASMAADSASQESDLKEAGKDEMDWGYEEGTVPLCSQSVEVVVGWWTQQLLWLSEWRILHQTLTSFQC